MRSSVMSCTCAACRTRLWMCWLREMMSVHNLHNSFCALTLLLWVRAITHGATLLPTLPPVVAMSRWFGCSAFNGSLASRVHWPLRIFLFSLNRWRELDCRQQLLVVISRLECSFRVGIQFDVCACIGEEVSSIWSDNLIKFMRVVWSVLVTACATSWRRAFVVRCALLAELSISSFGLASSLRIGAFRLSSSFLFFSKMCIFSCKFGILLYQLKVDLCNGAIFKVLQFSIIDLKRVDFMFCSCFDFSSCDSTEGGWIAQFRYFIPLSVKYYSSTWFAWIWWFCDKLFAS